MRIMAIRPEALSIGAGASDRNTLNGIVEDASFLGSVVRVRVRIGESVILVDTFNDSALPPAARGQDISINFSREDLIALSAN